MATGDYRQPTGQQWPPLPPTAVKKRRKKWPWIVGALVVLLLILIFSSAGSGGTTTPAGTTSTSGSQSNAQPAAAPAAPPKAISAHDWAKIAKDPDSHVGEAVVVYGEVTQFDAATGTDSFRANVDGVKHQVSYGFADYPTNTVLTNDGADLSDLVQGDPFQANAVVACGVPEVGLSL
jgi:hypothetical protein